MGYYIEAPTNKGKTNYLVQSLGGKEVSMPASFHEIPEGKMLVVVVDNGPFEACALANSEDEFRAFTEHDDPRPKRFVLLEEKVAKKQAGFR